MKLCPKCGVEVEDSVTVCPTCNHSFEAVAETAASAVNVAPEKSAEETFDHKPLVMEWYQNSGFAKFLFNVWPKINLIATLVSVVCSLLGVLIAALGLINQIPGVEKIIPDALAGGLGMSLLSFGIGLKVAVFAAHMVFHNDLKKILFSNFLKKKGVDLDVAAKYVFFHISVDNFSSIPRKEKGDLTAWLASPQYFGEAVMMAQNSSAKKTNIIWLCVLTAVSFVCQTIENSVILSLVGGFFGLDFEAGWDQLGNLVVLLIVFIVFAIACTIANAIVSGIGTKKKALAKATWAVSVTNPEAQNVEVISA